MAVFDYSSPQLSQAPMLAEREGLDIKLVQGEMADLSEMADETFGLLVQPCSDCLVPNVLPAWKDASPVIEANGNAFVIPSRHINQARFLWGEFACVAPKEST